VINPFNKNDMYPVETLMSIETLIERTQNMNPVEFEDFADNNGIDVEWLEVCLTNYNDGLYHATLPQYGDAYVEAVDGSNITIII
jgi:hypothetical protein